MMGRTRSSLTETFLVAPAFAQDFGLEHARKVGLPSGKLPDLILTIINFSLVLAAVVALAFLVYGGFRYITSRGDEQEVKEAKQTITYAVIGLVVIGIAAALVNFVIGAVLGGGPLGGGDGATFPPGPT